MAFARRQERRGVNGEPDFSACPVCGRSDQSQPVSAIVDGQSSYVTSYGSSVGMGYVGGRIVPAVASHRSFSTARSPLAQMLHLPYPVRSTSKARIGILLMIPFLLLALAPGLILSQTGTVDHSNPWAGTLGGLVVFSPIFITSTVLIIMSPSDRRRWQQRVAMWERAMFIWTHLRYCHRDHVVYEWPEVYFPPAATRQYSYDRALHAVTK
jgi:hypothetical protein